MPGNLWPQLKQALLDQVPGIAMGDVADFGEERDATVGVGDSLVGAEQSQRGRDWVLVEPSGMEPRSVREAERFTRWRGGRSG